MRKYQFRSAVAVAAFALGAVALAGCGSGSTTAGPTVPNVAGPSIATSASAPSSAAPIVTGAAATPGPSSTDPGPAASCAAAHSWGTVPATSASPASQAPVYNVRVGQHPEGCYDRVVVDINGPATAGYTAQYVDHPQTDAQGAPLAVPGRAYLQVGIRAPILGQDSQGHQPWRTPLQPGYQFVTPEQMELAGSTTIQSVVYGGSSEGSTLVVVGLASPLGFRISSWTDASSIQHLIIDIRRP